MATISLNNSSILARLLINGVLAISWNHKSVRICSFTSLNIKLKLILILDPVLHNHKLLCETNLGGICFHKYIFK